MKNLFLTDIKLLTHHIYNDKKTQKIFFILEKQIIL